MQLFTFYLDFLNNYRFFYVILKLDAKMFTPEPLAKISK